MEIGKVWLDALNVGSRHRQVDAAKVDALADSMKEIGLQQPISVWFDADDGMHLVAGLHRVRAAEKLGWEQIDAVTLALDPLGREMWEISENLHRADLTKDERDNHIRRYAELLEQRRENKVGQSELLSPPTGRGNKGIARQIADETGLSKSTVQRALNPEPPKPPVNVPSQEDIDHRDFERILRAWNAGSPGGQDLFRDFLA